MGNNLDNQLVKLGSASQSEVRFRNLCSTLFQRMNPNEGVDLDENIWVIQFSHEHYASNKVTLDFTPFCKRELAFDDTFKLMLDDESEVVLSPVMFAKWLFLELVQDRAIDYRIVWLLNALKMLFLYLKENETQTLTEANLTDFYSILLTHDFENDRFVKRLSIPAYGSRFKNLDLAAIYKLLARHRINTLVSPIDRYEQNEALNEACLSQAGMTLTDYKAGGTFDFLGLDIGRHYVDYCADFFEKNISFTTAVRKTRSSMSDLIERIAGLKRGTMNRLNKVVVNTLKGGPLPTEPTRNRTADYELYELELMVYNKSVETFVSAYNECVKINRAFSLDVLNDVATDLCLKEYRLDTHEFIRAMLYARFVDSNIKSRERILAEYKSLIQASDFENKSFKLQLREFDEVCDKHLTDSTIEPAAVTQVCEKYFNSYVKSSNEPRNLNDFISDVEGAGVTLFAAYTGWRASEFGFPMSSISVKINIDVKDSAYTPFRFYVNWTASKTSGNTTLQREITLSTAMVANQLAELNASSTDKPALISAAYTDYPDLSQKIADRVQRLWFLFPYDYSLFSELDELERLSAGKEDSSPQHQLLFSQLKQKYDIKNSAVQDAIKLRDQLRNDACKLELSKRQYRGDNGSTIRFAETLKRYAQKTLDKSSTQLLNENLSEDTKKSLFLSFSHDSVNNEVVRSVREELVAGVVKATPHAFRHIWAEAILQRYRGDVGRFIRANFKHIDERFFMAYLRNKEVKSIYDVAKRTTINSVVRKHVSSLNDKQRSFAGGFDRFVSKAVNITNVVTHEQYVDIANKIANKRILDIKSNAWATCLLRVGTEHQAKCSVDGIPQRQNAEPKLCLGCVNADIASTNYAGIVIYTKNDVEACTNPNLPASIKQYHVATLRKALLRVRELKVNEGCGSYDAFIAHLESVINAVDNEGQVNG